MITIKEAKTKKELKQFVKFPFSLYKGSKYWVPPIIADELATFDRKKNPVFESAEANLLLAYKDGKIVGRVAAIVNWVEVNQQQLKKMRFGWFDFIDDFEVSAALLEEVTKIGRSHQLEYMEGPVGFSNLDKVGVITEGFDHIGNMITWYNHPYYAGHFEKHGFETEKVYLENKFRFKGMDASFFTRVQALIKRRYKLREVNFTKTKDVLPYADEMFELFNTAYAPLASFVPITKRQQEYFKEKYISFINPEYIKFVVDENDKMVAFAIVLPSFSKALQKANGKLFPFGIFHMLNARKHSKYVTFYLIGVHPDYQNKGVTAVIFNEYYEAFNKRGVIDCIRTPELVENTAIHQIWKNFNPVTHRHRKTFKKML